MKTRAGTASPVQQAADRRSVTRQSAAYSAASTAIEPAIPASTRVEKLDPKRRKKTDSK